VKTKSGLKLLGAAALLTAACRCSSQLNFNDAVVHFYDLKIAANGERMTRAALRACQSDPGCGADQQSQLRDAWIAANSDYKAKRRQVERERAAGYHANMGNLPAFGQDPSLGFDSL
jgi:hypothetical protein